MSETRGGQGDVIENAASKLTVYTSFKTSLFMINTVGAVVESVGGWNNLATDNKIAVGVLISAATILLGVGLRSARGASNSNPDEIQIEI